MTLNNFADMFPLSYETLKVFKKNDSLPRVVGINNNAGINIDELPKILVAMYMCEKQNPYCKDCKYCNAIDKDCFSDYIHFDSKQSNLTIADAVTELKKPSLNEKKNKFLFIKNIENIKWEKISPLIKKIYRENTYMFLFFSTSNMSKIDKLLESAFYIIHSPFYEKKLLSKEHYFKAISDPSLTEQQMKKTRTLFFNIFRDENSYISQRVYFNSRSSRYFLAILSYFIEEEKFKKFLKKSLDEVNFQIHKTTLEIGKGLNPTMLVDAFLQDNFKIF